MIQVQDLSVITADGAVLLSNVSLLLTEPGVYCLTGPSGSGKTTLLNAIAGLIPSRGLVRTGEKVAYLFQEDRLLQHLSARKNIELTAESKEEADRLIRAFGIDEFEKKKPPVLSGGMKRRVALARCLAFGGTDYLLDEPFRGLDAGNREDAAKEIRAVAQRAVVLLVTHDESDLALLSARPLPLDSLVTQRG